MESKIEGDLDLRGFLGIDPAVRYGYEKIRMTRIKSNADDRRWAKLGLSWSGWGQGSRRCSIR